MIENILILALGFFLLVKGADFLVTGASSIAKKFNTKESIIMELNNIPFPDFIREGREIIVPINKEKYFLVATIDIFGSICNCVFVRLF